MNHITHILKSILEKLQSRAISSVDQLTDAIRIQIRLNINSQFWEKIHLLIENYQDQISIRQSYENPDPEKLAIWFQRNLDQNIRKSFAANYTSISSSLIIQQFIPQKDFRHIIDPFAGSGRLIISLLNSPVYKKNFPNITINEYMPFACILAYDNVLSYFITHNQPTEYISVFLGDAFEIFSNYIEKYDLVIMNPPFTRVHRMEIDIKTNIQYLKENYPELIIGQPGLHFYALLLTDRLLCEGGTVLSILPGSTFISQYSKPLMQYYLKKYKINSLVKFSSSSAFSDDSALKEVVLVAQKFPSVTDWEVDFQTIVVNDDKHILQTARIKYERMKENWNWLKFFENDQLLQLESELFNLNVLVKGSQLQFKLIRGVEMYGPDFFCFPNRNWTVIEKLEDSIVIGNRNSDMAIKLPKIVLKKALRKSGLYNQSVTPSIDEYIFAVPQNYKNDTEITRYCKLNNTETQIARKKFGDNWLHHISDQLNSKLPYGHLFFIDKLSLHTAGVVSHFFNEEFTSTKNFYILKGNAEELELQAAWLNSSCFLVLYLLNRREIGHNFGRMQIMDYLDTSLFLNLDLINTHNTALIMTSFNNFRKIRLPSIKKQIGAEYRRELDIAILRGIGIAETKLESMIEKIYSALTMKLS